MGGDTLIDEWEALQPRWRRAWIRADRAETTWHNYCLDARHYLDWCKERGVYSLSLDSADEYVAHWESRGKYAGRNAARAIKALGKFYAGQYEEPDPFQRLTVPKPGEPKKTPTATDDDLRAMLDTCDDTWQGKRDRAIILVLAHTGIRRSEVANMSPEDLDLGNQLLAIPKTKTRRPRTVWVNDEAVDALLRFRRVSPDPDLCWPAGSGGGGSLGSGLTAPGIGQMIRRREKKAGVQLGTHAFRRRYAGEWIAKGGTEVGLMEQAGWSSTQMIARYSKDVAQKNSIAEAERLMGDRGSSSPGGKAK